MSDGLLFTEEVAHHPNPTTPTVVTVHPPSSTSRTVLLRPYPAGPDSPCTRWDLTSRPDTVPLGQSLSTNRRYGRTQRPSHFDSPYEERVGVDEKSPMVYDLPLLGPVFVSGTST